MKFTSTSFPRQVSLSKHLSEQSYLYKDSLWWVFLFKIWHEWEIFRTKKKFIFSHLHYREKYVLHIFHKESKGIRMITISLLFLNFHWCTFFFGFCLFFFFRHSYWHKRDGNCLHGWRPGTKWKFLFWNCQRKLWKEVQTGRQQSRCKW